MFILKNKKIKKKTTITLSLLLFLIAVSAFSFTFKSNNAKAACAYPAQILDLTNWKQTLPIGSSESPTEIKQTLLSTYSKAPYFTTNASCDGVIFRAPVNGVTTSGSGYPRSELREMTNNGTTNASWSTTSGAHSMTITQAITSVPQSKKHVVAGQIHDASNDIVVIRLEYPKLFIDIGGKTGPVLDANYTLGKKFTVQFVAAGGQIKVYYNGNSQPAYTMSKSGSGNYFKAGAYTQSNCSKESVCSENNYGEVAIYDLKIQHQSSVSAILISSTTPSTTTTTIPSTTTTSTTTTSTTTPSTITTSTASGAVNIEAESGVITSPMTIVQDSLASNGNYITQATDTGKGTAKYLFNIPSEGKYQLNAKVISPNGSSNSFYYNIDSLSTSTWSLPDNIKSWTWVNGTTSTLTKGTHTLVIKKREKNTKIDALEFKPITDATNANENIEFEAESGTATGGMTILSDSLASGGKFIQANSSGSINYAVNVLQAGTYKIAGWIKAANTSSDSFYASIDSNSPFTWSLPLSTTSWLYDVNDNNTFSLSTGLHTLTLKYREAGAEVDKILLLKQ